MYPPRAPIGVHYERPSAPAEDHAAQRFGLKMYLHGRYIGRPVAWLLGVTGITRTGVQSAYSGA